MLWQTAEVRLSKLRVRDEINEALRYYHSSIFETRAGAARRPRPAGARAGSASRSDNPRAISMGSWIGGDRDGNPYVTADVLRLGGRRHRRRPRFGHHLTALHALVAGAVDVGPPDRRRRPRSRRWPRRRATTRRSAPTSRTGARCAACTPGCGAIGRRGARRGTGPAASRRRSPPYASPDELIADLDIVADSLSAHGAGELAAARVMPLRRAVEIFRTHLCGLDLRQNSDVHEQVVAELLARGRRRRRLRAARRGSTGSSVLTAELRGSRPLVTPFVDYSDAGRSRAGRAARGGRRRTPGSGRDHPPRDHLEGRVGQRRARAGGAAQGGRAGAGRRRRPAAISSAVDIVPLFETITDLRDADRTLDAMLAPRPLPPDRRQPRRPRRR